MRWDGSGHQDGRFEYQNSSTNYPWNKMYTAINIR
nr:YolA family protein [Bacillus sp. AFS014408]